MAKPLTDDERQRIITLIEAGKGCAEIAREVGRAVDTVSRIGKDIGHTFGRTNLARALEARSAYSAEARAASAARAQERLDEVLALMGERQQVAVGTREGVEVVSLKPDARAWKDWAQAVNMLQRTVLDVKRADDQGNGDAGARGLLERLVEGLESVAA